MLRKLWELEENPTDRPVLSPQEHAAVKHFEKQHYHFDSGRFVVKWSDAKLLGESRSQAVRRFTNSTCQGNVPGIQECGNVTCGASHPRFFFKNGPN